MALLNIAAMTADKKVDGVMFEIDDRTAKGLLELFKRCDGLIGHEAMANVRRALEEISDVKMLTAENAAILAAEDSSDNPQPVEPTPAPGAAPDVPEQQTDQAPVPDTETKSRRRKS